MIARISNSQNAVANPSELANDTLRGAEEIAEFLYGDRTKRRKVYHNASRASVNPLPTFRDGNLICARKSTILEWIKAQEARSMAGTARCRVTDR
jgi:hypothetical protein